MNNATITRRGFKGSIVNGTIQGVYINNVNPMIVITLRGVNKHIEFQYK